MLYLPVEIDPFYLIFLLGFPFGFLGALLDVVIKPVAHMGKLVVERLGDPNKDIFGRNKDRSQPDPIQEGLRAAATTATANIQSRQDTALSDIGLAPKPVSKTNLALVVAVIAVVFLIAKR